MAQSGSVQGKDDRARGFLVQEILKAFNNCNYCGNKTVMVSVVLFFSIASIFTHRN